MKEILLVNLTRLGDLLQTTPVMAALKGAYPDTRITLLANADFAEICRDIPFVDRLVAFDKTGFRKMVRGEEHTLVGCFRRFESFVDSVNETDYDLAINFTASGECALLASLFRAREVRGVTTDDTGNRAVKHPWQRYFMSVIPSRRYNPFHLCDMFVKAGGVPPLRSGLHLRVPEEVGGKARAVLRENGVADDDLLVGFQLGASQSVKTWPVASFAGLADRLAEALGAKILLTGARSEEALGKEFESLAASKAVNRIGRTDLREAAALLRRCALFVSNDSGPLHIATAVGTRSLDLSLGHACFRETGPYGEGHYVIEADVPCGPCGFNVRCENPRCREMITVDTVFEVASRILSAGTFEAVEDAPAWSGVRVYRSVFAEDGLLDYVPLVRRPLSRETFYAYLYRETWPALLDGTPDFSVERTCAALEAKAAASHGAGALGRCVASLCDDLDTARRMELLAAEALSRVSLIVREAGKPSPDADWIRRIWSDVPAIDREMETLGRTRPPLMPPVTLFRFGKEGLEGRDLAALAKSTLGLYETLAAHFAMLAGVIGFLAEKQVKIRHEACHT